LIRELGSEFLAKHHLFPRSLFRTVGEEEGLVSGIGNITLISPSLNSELSDNIFVTDSGCTGMMGRFCNTCTSSFSGFDHSSRVGHHISDPLFLLPPRRGNPGDSDYRDVHISSIGRW